MAAGFGKIDILRHFRIMYFSSTLIADLTEYASMQGVDAGGLVRAPLAWQQQSHVSYAVMVHALTFLEQELNDVHLGLHIGEQLSLKATAPVDDIMLNSQTLEDSINNAIEYSKVISDALTCSLQKTDQHFAVIYEENPNWRVQQQHARRQVLDMALLSNVKSLAAYTNYRYYPVEVQLSYEKPKTLTEHYRLFNCRLKFNQARAAIIYDRRIMDRHAQPIQRGLLEELKEKVAAEIQQLPAENELIYKLKKCILHHKPARLPIGQAARVLALSTRTLQRKLLALQTTFKKIEAGLLLKLAQTYLEEGQKSIEEISYLLGFSETSAFSRFFKDSTGGTPREYRKGGS